MTDKSIKKRNSIINLTKDLFFDSDISNVSLNNVLATLSISKSTFYSLFESKNEFVYEVVVAEKIRIEEYYDSIKDKHCYINQLRLITKYLYTQISETSPTIFLNHLQDSLKENGSENYSSFEHHEFYKIYRKIIEDGMIAEKVEVNNSVDEIIKILVNCSLGMIFIWGYSNDDYDLVQRAVEVNESVISLFIVSLDN